VTQGREGETHESDVGPGGTAPAASRLPVPCSISPGDTGACYRPLTLGRQYVTVVLSATSLDSCRGLRPALRAPQLPDVPPG